MEPPSEPIFLVKFIKLSNFQSIKCSNFPEPGFVTEVLLTSGPVKCTFVMYRKVCRRLASTLHRTTDTHRHTQNTHIYTHRDFFFFTSDPSHQSQVNAGVVGATDVDIPDDEIEICVESGFISQLMTASVGVSDLLLLLFLSCVDTFS